MFAQNGSDLGCIVAVGGVQLADYVAVEGNGYIHLCRTNSW